MVEWNQSIPKPQRNKRFASRIINEESSGVLNRLLAGLADWLSRGNLGEPQQAEQHKTRYLRSEDWRLQFTDEACVIVPSQPGTIGRSTSELYEQYKQWQKSVNPNARLMSKNSFSNSMAEKFERVETTVQGRHWRGFPTLEIRPLFGMSLQMD